MDAETTHTLSNIYTCISTHHKTSHCSFVFPSLFPFFSSHPRPLMLPSPETSIYVYLHICKLHTHMYTCVVWCDCAKQTGFFCQKTPSSVGLFHKRDLTMMKVDSLQASLAPSPFLSRTQLPMYVRTHLLQIAKCSGVFEVRLVALVVLGCVVVEVPAIDSDVGRINVVVLEQLLSTETHIHRYTCTCTHKHTHVSFSSFSRAAMFYTHSYTYTYAHRHTHTHKHTHMQASTRTQLSARVRACVCVCVCAALAPIHLYESYHGCIWNFTQACVTPHTHVMSHIHVSTQKQVLAPAHAHASAHTHRCISKSTCRNHVMEIYGVSHMHASCHAYACNPTNVNESRRVWMSQVSVWHLARSICMNCDMDLYGVSHVHAARHKHTHHVTHIRLNSNTGTRTCTRTRTHTHTHTHMHTHTHTHTTHMHTDARVISRIHASCLTYSESCQTHVHACQAK